MGLKWQKHTIIHDKDHIPPVKKRSRAKIWIRTAMLAVFGTLFTVFLIRDYMDSAFEWWLIPSLLLPCLLIGFVLSRFVPMQIYTHHKHVTLSFDIIYFVLIWVLVIAKLITSKIDYFPAIIPDSIMIVIIGLMSGRLSGICLRVRAHKKDHRFLD